MAPTTALPTRRQPARRGAGEALRTEIIDAASDLLAETGDVALMSLRAVGRRVGIATTSIYLHFADMDTLVLAVKARRFDELTRTLAAAIDRAGTDPLARAKALGHAYVAFGLEHPGHYRVMFSAAVAPRPTMQVETMIGAAAFRLVVEVAAAAVDAPVDDPEVHLVATELWSFVDGVIHLRTARPSFPWPDLARQLDDLVDRLLGPHRPRIG